MGADSAGSEVVRGGSDPAEASADLGGRTASDIYVAYRRPATSQEGISAYGPFYAVAAAAWGLNAVCILGWTAIGMIQKPELNVWMLLFIGYVLLQLAGALGLVLVKRTARVPTLIHAAITFLIVSMILNSVLTTPGFLNNPTVFPGVVYMLVEFVASALVVKHIVRSWVIDRQAAKSALALGAAQREI
ncbi:MAG: hypothetical protein JSS65_08770 [Armatimonadetes bacterium]|nr:hypothetical protein [Armatimonadota bacterium]